MKQQYWDQGFADADDRALQEAIKLAIVPEKCMLGGGLVLELAKNNRDPCEWCPCPERDTCKGRPQKHTADAAEPIDKSKAVRSMGEVGARSVIRHRHQQVLDSLTKE